MELTQNGNTLANDDIILTNRGNVWENDTIKAVVKGNTVTIDGLAGGGELLPLLVVTDKSAIGDDIIETITIEKAGVLVGALTGYVDNYTLKINGSAPVESDTLVHIPSYRNYQGYIFKEHPVMVGDVIETNFSWSGGGACSVALYEMV